MNHLIGFVAAAATFTSFASLAGGIDSKEARFLKELTNGKLAIVETFSTDIGLSGFVVQDEEGEGALVYVDKKLQFMVSGVAINKNKEILGKEQIERLMASAKSGDESAFEQAFEKAEKAKFAKSGKSEKYIYVVVEPNCVFCKQFGQTVKPFVDRDELEVRWLLVGYDENGEKLVSSLVGQKDIASAVIGHLSGKEIKASKSVSARAEEWMSDAVEVAALGALTGTPGIIYKRNDGSFVSQSGALNEDQVKELISTL